MALTNGLVVMTPSSVAKTGGSSTATINSDGSVTFGSCETLSLNGVFTSAYDNYMVVARHLGANNAFNFNYRLRSGSTDASGANYTDQFLGADGTTVSASRSTGLTFSRISSISTSQRSGLAFYLFGPFLAQPTASRSVTIEAFNDGRIIDFSNTHSLSTSYDGLTIFPGTPSNFTGLVTVFGFAQ